MWKEGDENHVVDPLVVEPVACSLAWGGRYVGSAGRLWGRSTKVSVEDEEPRRVGRRDGKPNP